RAVAALGEAGLQIGVAVLALDVEAAVAAVRGHRRGEPAVAERALSVRLLRRLRRTGELLGAVPATADAGDEQQRDEIRCARNGSHGSTRWHWRHSVPSLTGARRRRVPSAANFAGTVF